MKHGMRPGPFHVSPSRNRRGRRRRPRPVRRQVRNRASSSAKESKTGTRKVLGIVLGAFVLLLIIGIAGHHGTSTPTGSASSAPTVAPTHTVTSAPGVTTVKAVKKHPIKKRTVAATSRAVAPSTRAAPSTHTAPSPPVQTTPAATPTPSAGPTGCYPLSDEGTCYEPGEYCRDSDHGSSGVAGDGEAITCEDNDGWRWEPS
jgi:hypothetical protein